MGKLFFGTYSRSLDPKGRLLLPRELGIAPGTTLYVMKGFEGCLSIYQEEEFQKIVMKLMLFVQNYSLVQNSLEIKEVLVLENLELVLR